jgi:hypothetical protein
MVNKEKAFINDDKVDEYVLVFFKEDETTLIYHINEIITGQVKNGKYVK